MAHQAHASIADRIGLALQRYRAGDVSGAEAIYQQVLEQAPDSADALHLYGCLCDGLGRSKQAIALVTRACACNPAAYPYFYNLANMLVKQDRLDEAIACFQTAIRLKPDYAVAHNNLGLALKQQGQRVKAKACFEKAIRLLPGHYVDPCYNLGLELQADGDYPGAVTAFSEVIRIQPGYADANYQLGITFSMGRNPEAAEAAFREVLQSQPENPKAHNALGSELLKLGRLEEAVRCFRQALRIDPVDVMSHNNLIIAASYLSADPAAMQAECAQWERVHGAPLQGAAASHANLPEPGRRLRIGYVSADFRAHAAAYWIEPLLGGHSHDGFEIFCYSNSDSTLAGELTDRLKHYADVWVECALLSDDDMAARIRQDQIDILVDLSGPTQGNRLLVFARQPAPLQVSWFGFPVSTGLKTMTYRFTDALIDPVGSSDAFYSEALIRLPRFYAAFRPDPQTPEPGDGPVAQKGDVTFASFNNFAKITQPMLALWAEILRSTPNSRLLIQSAGLDGAGLGGHVRTFFAENGVIPERLILRGWSGLKDYLALGQEADIALDPYPFNGGVTTCHALWMGLPVVSLSGQSAASRIGRSLLTHAGLPELVADNPAQYCAIAVGLAQDRVRLAALRASMRGRMASGGLLDGPGLASDVEAAYREIWQAWCAGQGDGGVGKNHIAPAK